MIVTDKKYSDLLSSSVNFSNPITCADQQSQSLQKLLVDYDNEIKSLRERLLQKELELDSIYNSRGWLLLNCLYCIRKFFIPRGSAREQFIRRVFRMVKNIPQYDVNLFHSLVSILRQKIKKVLRKTSFPEKYDLFVFSICPWDYLFQRPQQIARQFAQAGHRVFYISWRFTTNASAYIKQIEHNVFELCLVGDPCINIYQQQPSPDILKSMMDSLHKFCLDNNCSTGVLLVQLPFWTSLVEKMRIRFGWPIIYDCMDDHSGFTESGYGKDMLSMEKELFEQADLIVTSSGLLEKKAKARSSKVALIRNAADYKHFASVAARNKVNGKGKVAVGYYGTIADWFNSELMYDLAVLRPDWDFNLVGVQLTSADLNRLKTLNNVKLLGERPYAELPGILSGWNACIIPFRKMPLTDATNPVKVYEMLAAGMPVVSVDLPELRPIAQAGLIRIAQNACDFAEQIKRMLDEQSPELIKTRQDFARKNTWSDRYDAMNAAIASTFPKVSIIILMHNNLELNKLCLESILRKTDYPNYEIILVDNASTDGSREYALDLSKNNNHIQVILNTENESFAKANNRAIDACTGEYVAFLNNDTIVTRGWITRFLSHLKNDQSIGMIGPVSNAIGNEAKIDVNYTSLDDIDDFAEQYCRRHSGEIFDIPVLALFCSVIKRDLLENIGRLDECYDVGMFEDDDLCMRIKNAGFRLVCTEDVFIHHFHQGTFKLLDPDVFKEVFEANRRKFENKWGPWKPHQQRKDTNRCSVCRSSFRSTIAAGMAQSSANADH